MPIDEFGRVLQTVNQREESPPPYHSSSRQRDRGESPYFDRRPRGGSSDHHQYLPTPGSGDSKWRQQSSPPRHRRSPSPRNNKRSQQRPKGLEAAWRYYVEEPMLCQYVWKTEMKLDGDRTNNKDDSNNQQQQDDEKVEADGNDHDSDNEPKAYDEYRKRYCLNYVRQFFNQHMDDFWFRSRYSPLVRRRLAMDERERAAKETTAIREEIEASLQEEEKGDSDDRCSFVRNARLAGGFTPAAVVTPVTAPISRKRKHGDPAPPQQNQKQNQQQKVPKSHLLSVASKALAIQEIPPHVTDEQLCVAVMEHCTMDVKGEGIRIYSSSVTVDGQKPLLRDAFCIFDSEEIRNDVLNNMIKVYTDANSLQHRITPSSTGAAADDAIHVPRKDDIRVPDALALDVECSDPYGRQEVDADGKGGAPEDGTAVPSRKSTVLVLTQTPLQQPVLLLTAAVSSRERISRDKEAAIMLARALDVSRSIPKENRLDDLLELLFPPDEADDQVTTTASLRNKMKSNSVPSLEEDMLDVSIAYLRRVHLFCFYNGCTFAHRVGDVLSGRHPAGTIHMRLHNADELLGEAREDEEAMYADIGNTTNNNISSNASSADLLVRRLDDSIAKALEESNQWVAQAGSCIVDETIDKLAAEIEEAEDRAKDQWLDAHCLMDDDGRARCSFHFCKKLFKDNGFLRKHLLKKHSEHLRAAIAQAHDGYMMKGWDMEEQRPVPPIMVYCGTVAGLVESKVIGKEPWVADPEPDIWKKEEERRKRLQAGGGDAFLQPYHERGRPREGNRRDGVGAAAGGIARGGEHEGSVPLTRSASSRGTATSTFVDVDDMKEEKVEIVFDDIVVPVQPPETTTMKKKKKKKLL